MKATAKRQFSDQQRHRISLPPPEFSCFALTNHFTLPEMSENVSDHRELLGSLYYTSS